MNLIENDKTTNFFSKIKDLLIFALPIMVGNVGQMLIGACDVFVAAKHSPQTLAAISIANAIVSIILLVGLGLIFAISNVLSKKRGEGENINKYFKINLLYALMLSIIFGLISLIPYFLIPYMGFEKTLVPYIQDFIIISSFSFTGAYLYQGLKEFLQSFENVLFANSVSIVAIFVNLILEWNLVFGNEFIKPMGVNGLATANLCVRLFMGLSLLWYCRKYLKNAFYFDVNYLKQLFKVGYPLSVSIFLEMSAFSLTTLIAGRIGTIQVAAHNIVMTLASTTFMLPMSIANALGVKIGFDYGEKNYRGITENLSAGLIISLSIMGFFALLFFFIPEKFMQFFSPNPDIIMTGASLLFVVALFQIFDGTQVTLSGALRGLHYTKPIMATMTVGYWLIGIPLGLYLAFICKMQVLGLWVGLAVALFICSCIFYLFLKKRLKKIRSK